MTDQVRVEIAKDYYDSEHLLGTFLDDSHYDLLIDEDCDFYAPPGVDGSIGEHNILFKLRKNVYSEDEMNGVYHGLIELANNLGNNRGIAAGPRSKADGTREWVSTFEIEILEAMMDDTPKVVEYDAAKEVLAQWEGKDKKIPETKGRMWLRYTIEQRDKRNYESWFSEWLDEVLDLPMSERKKEAMKVKSDYMSTSTYGENVHSSICGFFDRFPRLPYGRECVWNEKNPEKFKMAFPYLKKLDHFFSELLPERYGNQKRNADSIDSRFRIAGEETVFTTLTVNKTFRTAAHRDAGDLSEGFSNLGVVLPPEGKGYRGGYLVLPEYRVAVNIRPGDVLLINNHEGIHGNTEILPIDDDCCPDCIERISLVAYFREKMVKLGSWEYEQARKEFVESRRKNQDHELWHKRWNGVSPGMWDQKEWFDFLREKGMQEELDLNHPNHADIEGTNDLSEFFG